MADTAWRIVTDSQPNSMRGSFSPSGMSKPKRLAPSATLSSPTCEPRRTIAEILDFSNALLVVIMPSNVGFGISAPHSPRIPSRPPTMIVRLSIGSSSTMLAGVKPFDRPEATTKGKKAVPRGFFPSSMKLYCVWA